MKYLLLCALLISGAFFFDVSSQENSPPLVCEPGETPLQNVGGCGKSAPSKGCKIISMNGRNPSGNAFYYGDSIDEYKSRLANYNQYPAAPTCPQPPTANSIKEYTTDISFSCTEAPEGQTSFYKPYNIITDITDQILKSSPCRLETAQRQTVSTHQMGFQIEWTDDVQCPTTHPLGPISYDDGQLIGQYCYRIPEPEPCDCSELAGEGTLPYSSFLAKNGVYTDANPPQCVDVTDTETGQQCQCQLVAKKWLQTNAGESTRWSPLPYDKDKPSGTYTGVACGAEEADTAPPEKEQCFTLKSGIKWCFADPAEKCTVINGQEQCSSGCGYVNGDFVCYEENDPVIPDRPNEDLNEIDDTITDPNKLMPDMNKGDLKEIQKGTEQRLDNVIIATNNNTNELQNIGDEIGQTNSKLDGIGQQLDGQGKTLKGIENGLDDAFGDEGSPDGACEGDCTGSWYESAYPDGIIGIWQEHSEALNQTPMFEFLNQFSFQPSGTQPDMSICFNLGQLGDFGCKTLEVPAGVWAFLKLCILITAAFFSYRIIAGV